MTKKECKEIYRLDIISCMHDFQNVLPLKVVSFQPGEHGCITIRLHVDGN